MSVHYSNAVNCKAIEHCTRTYWRTQNPPEDVQGISCMFCTKGMDVVMREVKKHYTQVSHLLFNFGHIDVHTVRL